MSQETPLPPDAAKLKEELEAKAAEIRAKAGVPPEIQIGAPPPPPVIQMPKRPMPPIPDHIGASARAELPPQPARPPMEGGENKDRLDLDAAKGSELHLMSLQAQLLGKEAEKASLRLEVAKRDSKIAELERQLITEKANEQQRQMAERMKEYGVPDGWNFTRKIDGTYVLEKAKPNVPAR